MGKEVRNSWVYHRRQKAWQTHNWPELKGLSIGGKRGEKRLLEVMTKGTQGEHVNLEPIE